LSLILFIAIIILLSAFLSSKRHNLDSLAVKHLVSSFRFAVCALFLVQWVLLVLREAILGYVPYLTVPKVVLLALIFLECSLLDCCPHFPATSQILVSVICNCCHFFAQLLNLMQATWCMAISFWLFQTFQYLSIKEIDCFLQVGAYEVCDLSFYMSIYINLFFLMFQNLVSRILVPGRSIFLNASVRH
jgi:hypothetical protein